MFAQTLLAGDKDMTSKSTQSKDNSKNPDMIRKLNVLMNANISVVMVTNLLSTVKWKANMM